MYNARMKQISVEKIKLFFAKKRVITLIAVIFILILGSFYLYNYTSFSPKNYAKDIVAPIEKELTASGAVKVCERGDNGKGIDNREPWYGATYTISLSQAESIELLQNTYAQAGYPLIHASPTNRGYLTIDDAYIDKWFFSENTTSPFSDLETGRMEVVAQVNARGLETSCPTPIVAPQSNTSIIGLSIDLPRFR